MSCVVGLVIQPGLPIALRARAEALSQLIITQGQGRAPAAFEASDQAALSLAMNVRNRMCEWKSSAGLSYRVKG
jgi:hypothetical protein